MKYMKKYITHLTMNTAHSRKSYSDEVSKEIYVYMRGIINKAMSGEDVELLDNTTFKLTVEGKSYIGTIYAKTEKGSKPILTTGGTSDENDKKYVWNELIKLERATFGESKIAVMPPAVPFVADLLLPFAIINLEALSWTGDFTKCLAWMVLFPSEII